jgi:hypothetical protein
LDAYRQTNPDEESKGMQVDDEGPVKKVVRFAEQSKIKKLPFGVRCVIYSYMDLMSLLNTITKLCKQERDKIPQSEVLDQIRCLRIHIKQGKMI